MHVAFKFCPKWSESIYVEQIIKHIAYEWIQVYQHKAPLSKPTPNPGENNLNDLRKYM